MTKPYEETQDSQYVSLQGGQYWRAVVDIPEFDVKEGTVLLLQSVRDVEGEAHTVIMRPHPSRFTRNSWDSDYRFLVQDFLRKFVEEPDYKRIRNEELARIQGKVADLQKQLAEANTNPTIMHDYVEKGVTEWEKGKKLLPGSTKDLPTEVAPQVIDQSLTVDKVEQMKLVMDRNREVASLQANWIKEKVEEINNTVEAMTPFYKEQAAAALAATEDVRTHVAKLMTGIESLDLYVGTDVEVRTLKTGKSADIEIPLTIMQRKLFMDEELSAWAEVGGEFDFRSKDLFYEALTEHPSLVTQIFPTERCIVCVATTRRILDYTTDPWTNARLNEHNKEVFLLVRDGENIHLVHSPIESHTKSRRLFPSQKEMSDIFVERSWSGKEKTITFQDVQYTDKLSTFEKAALHYKRFLILLAGLDHRLNLFGQFYTEPKGMNFVTLRFQEAHLRFIHDDDGENLLPEVDRLDFDEWAKSKNDYLRSGSRVMCLWKQVMTPSTAPGAVKDGTNYNYYFHAEPTVRYSVAIAYRDGKSICVKVLVKKDSWRSEREYDARVDLTRYTKNRSRDIGFLVLDAVKADELESYIFDRTSRENFLDYIRLFKAAVKYLREEEKNEVPARAAMRKALADGNVATGTRADEIIDQAVIAWRSAHRGAPLCDPSSPEYLKLLDQMYVLAKSDQDWQLAEKLMHAEGRKPLRLVLSGKNILSVYATPLESETDDRLWPMAWVTNIVLDRNKSGEFRVVQRRWRRLPASTATETTLYEWGEAERWKGRQTPIDKFEDKQHYFERIAEYSKQNLMLRPMTAAEWDVMFERYKGVRHQMSLRSRSRWVQNPHCYIPIGLEYHKEKNRLRWIVLGAEAQILLYQFAPDKERRERIAEEYADRYAKSDSALERIKEESRKRSINLGSLSIDNEPDAFGFSTVSTQSVYDWDFKFAKLDTELVRILKKEQNAYKEIRKYFWVPEFNIEGIVG